MGRRIYPDPAVERAVRDVREVREELSMVYAKLAKLEKKAKRLGRGRRAARIIDAWLEGRIGDEEAIRRLRRLVEA